MIITLYFYNLCSIIFTQQSINDLLRPPMPCYDLKRPLDNLDLTPRQRLTRRTDGPKTVPLPPGWAEDIDPETNDATYTNLSTNEQVGVFYIF